MNKPNKNPRSKNALIKSAHSKRRFLLRFINLWPPFLAAGIRIARVNKDWTEIDVTLRLWPWTKNIMGTHFGGSLYAMTDPFYMAMLIENLGGDYIIWDKAAAIRFKKPGRGKVTAQFRLTRARIDEIRAEADANYKTEPSFLVLVKDESGDVVAEVDKLIYVRRKDREKLPRQS